METYRGLSFSLSSNIPSFQDYDEIVPETRDLSLGTLYLSICMYVCTYVCIWTTRRRTRYDVLDEQSIPRPRLRMIVGPVTHKIIDDEHANTRVPGS